MPPQAARAVPFLALLVAAVALVPGTASADCVEAAGPMTLTCTDADVDGHVAANPNLTVDVQADATVDNGGAPGVHALELLNGNTVTTDVSSRITTTGDNADGINMTTGNTVTHGGTISVGDTGGGDTGSVGIAGGDGNTVTNDGVIDAFGSMARGIELGNAGALSGVTNNGDIAVDGDDSIGVSVGSGHQVDNTRTVSVAGDNAIAVQLGDGSNLDNDSVIGVGGDGSRAVVTGTTSSTIDNAAGARISSSSDAGDDIAIDFSAAGAGQTNTLINDGTIQSDFQAILGGAGMEQIENHGNLLGDVALGDGDDQLDLHAGGIATGMLDGGANGVGGDRLRLRGSGIGTLDLNQVVGFERLEIDDDPDTTLSIWGLSGTAGFANGILLNDGAAIQVDDTTTFSAGDFTAASGSALSIVVDPGVSNGRLSVNGPGAVADLTGGPELVLVPLGPLQTETLTVLDAAGAILGGFGTIPADTPLLDFTLVPMANQIDLQIVRNSYASLAQSPNQRAAASHLDAILAAGVTDLDMNDALLGLENLTAAGLSAAFEQLHAEPYDFHTGQAAALGRRFAEIATAPRPWCKPSLYGLRPAPRPEVPCGPRGWSAWMQALAGFGDRDAGGDFQQADIRVQGIAGGVDWRIDRNWLVTGWAGIASADLEADGMAEGDLETFEIGIATVFRAAGARVRAAFGYGRGNHEQDREIRYGGIDRTAESEYDSNRIHALMAAGWVFALGNLRLEPLAQLDVTWIQEDAFQESQASSLSLDVDERENTLVGTAFGGRIAYRHFQNPFSDHSPAWAQGTWTPEVNVAWRSTWVGADREIDARLRGAPASVGTFSSEAQDSEQGADVGAHLTFQPHGSGGSVSIGYDGFFGDNGTLHQFGAKLRLFF